MASPEKQTIRFKAEGSFDDDFTEEVNSTRIKAIKDEASQSASNSPAPTPNSNKASRSSSASGSQTRNTSNATLVKDENDGKNGHISPTKEDSKPIKLNRAASQKNPARIAPLFDDEPDATQEANKEYTVIDACTYQNKFLGFTEHAMECDCTEEWDSVTKVNHACGEDSDCINRATKMECVGDCACGSACQNQRFERRLYANVSVIKTEKKGYGLRTNVDLKSGDFIFEYIGEVIAEGAFRRRMVQYDEDGIKHFYFMSLSKGEFVDATRKGNLGRFCNHSCNPNCYVDKWVVGDKLRMGIFAERRIRAGEELVFNYNVDRYGANPQPCYCGESNCTGFIGGKTQTERATKLSTATIEALGIEDDFDAWDVQVAKKPKKKKTGEDDEEYVDSIQAKNLDADGVTKVMAALMQCKEKWIAVKLLQRIQRTEDEDVQHRIVKLHGYRIMNSQLAAWRDDENVVLQILDILNKFPRLTRNKIVDAKIDKTLEPMTQHADERVAKKARNLVEAWSKLELAYRIPRKVRDSAGTVSKNEGLKFERRESAQQRRKSRSRSRSRSKSPPRGPSATIPAGPRAAQRPNPPAFRRLPPPLPRGWSQAVDEKTGRTYFYTAKGNTQWVRPTQPAEPPPPPPPKQASQQDVLKSIIDDIVSTPSKDRDTTANQDTNDATKKHSKAEKWRSLDEEKQKKLYENTLFPYISHVMNKYKHKIPRDDLKRFGKEVAKKLVNSDYKAGRVKDPTKIEEKQQRKVKAFCKDYFDKAAQKHRTHEAEKAARKSRKDMLSSTITPSADVTPAQSPTNMDDTPIKSHVSDDEDVKMSDNEIDSKEMSNSPTNQSTAVKRKRLSLDIENIKDEDEAIQSPKKRANLDYEAVSPQQPPAPPAPPVDTPPETNTPIPDVDEMDTDIHADTNFKNRSMADVLAQAQQEGNDEDSLNSDKKNLVTNEVGMTRFEKAVDGIGIKLENSLVDGQVIVEKIKEEKTGAD